MTSGAPAGLIGERRAVQRGTLHARSGAPHAMSTGGLSEERLDRMHEVMFGHVDRGNVPGLVTLISRRGEVHVDAIGSKAVGADTIQRDTIFRISAMTKPITAAATM